MDQFSNDPFADNGPDDSTAQRNNSRDSLLLVAHVRRTGKTETIQARVRNLSAGGLMAEVPAYVETGMEVEVDVRGVGWVGGRIAWVTEGRAGIAFDHPIDPAAARKPVGVKPVPAKAKPIKPFF